jgi:surface antigen
VVLAGSGIGWLRLREAEILAGLLFRNLIQSASLVALLALAGCMQDDGEGGGFLESLRDKLSADYDPPDYDGPPLGDMPSYRRGDSYTYSSGRTETIQDVVDDRVVWRNDLDSSFERYPNFIFPSIETKTDRGQVARSFDVPPDTLWPLIPGTRRQFKSSVRVKLDGQNGERLFYREWICTVVGKAEVEVQFGKFESVEVACERYSRGKWRERRVWYYVPEIGHYVRRVDQFLGRDSRDTELVSIQQGFDGLSRDAKRELYDLEQQTLERMPSGKAANWRSDEGGFAVTMVVTKTMKTEAGQFCRTFRQTISGGGGDRLVPGLACRTWNGRWVHL